MLFFESFLGHYLTQAVSYSLITVIVVETVMAIWHIHEPLLRIKFRFLALFLPALCPPLYYLLYPDRVSEYFREQVALIDVNQWLALELGGGITIWHLFTFILLATAAIFLIEEAFPLSTHYLTKRPSFPAIKRGQYPRLDKALANTGRNEPALTPAILLSPENTPVAYISNHGTLVLSAAMIDLLDVDELQAVIAHEIAHHSRTVTRINRVLLVLRFWLFYNPVGLLVFHRIINDNEKLCDDMAIRSSGKRLSLTSGLLKIFRHSAAVKSAATKQRLWPGITSLQNTARRNLTRERVERVTQTNGVNSIDYQNLRVAVTALILAVLLFFIV
ncbi:MAG: M56 family metallopeptidase [Dehalococcoidales bacterium]|nr:M56 family metallopeptidase [Dehalococcoidales bacterium]